MFALFVFVVFFLNLVFKACEMRRVDLVAATLEGSARLDAAQRQRFFEACVKAALRLDRLEFRAWLFSCCGSGPRRSLRSIRRGLRFRIATWRRC